MNYPHSHSWSTNQWRNYVLGYTNTLTDEQNALTDQIKDSFRTQLDYFPVTKNLDTTVTYDALIYDGTKDTNIYGSKYFTSYPYDTVQFDIGDYVSFQYGNEYENWLITTLDVTQKYAVTGKIDRCTANLRWTDESGNTKSWPCVVEDYANHVMPEFNRIMIAQRGYMRIIVQQNDDTNTIKLNDRFLFGVSNNYTAFKVSLVSNFTKTKSIMFDMYVDTLSPNDDTVNGIASNDRDGITPAPTPPTTGTAYVISSTDTDLSTTDNVVYNCQVKQGTDNKCVFNVYTYINNVKQSDTFSIVASNVPSENYMLVINSGNAFTVTNNQMYNDAMLIITCTDDTNGTVAILNILLGGEF